MNEFMNHVVFTFPLFKETVVVTPWKIVGVAGALLFASRWLVSAYYSRKEGKPVTPRIFWIMSIFGSLITLAYFVFSPKQDLVGVLQNLLPFCTACYMLYLDLTHQKKAGTQAAVAKAEPVSVRAPAPGIHPVAANE